MEKQQMKTGKAIITFLVGGAMGVGAACLMSKVCKMRGPSAGTAGQKQDGSQTRPTTPYCAVPEGADICFPEQ